MSGKRNQIRPDAMEQEPRTHGAGRPLSRSALLGVIGLGGLAIAKKRLTVLPQEEQLVRAGAFRADGLGSSKGFFTGTGLVTGVDARGVKAGVIGTGDTRTSVGIQGASDKGTGVEAITNSGTALSVQSQSTNNAAVVIKSTGGTGIALSTASVGISVTAPNGLGLEVLGDRRDSINGTSSTGRGVVGISTHSEGVLGSSSIGAGVTGTSSHGIGVRGVSAGLAGVSGTSNKADGVVGMVTHGVWNPNTAVSPPLGGVHGIASQGGAGVLGENKGPAFGAAGPGVWGESQIMEGVFGVTHGQGAAVRGQNKGNAGTGVVGESLTGGAGVVGLGGTTGVRGEGTETGVLGLAANTSGGIGVRGTAQAGSGVSGKSTSGDGVFGTATHGVWNPNTAVSPPLGGVHGIASQGGAGVLGENKGPAFGAAGPGVWGESQIMEGVFGVTHGQGAAVRGQNKGNAGTGVVGESLTGGEGVVGLGGATGVRGEGTETGVLGSAASASGGIGVSGKGTTGTGVSGVSQSGVGVTGTSTDEHGVIGTSTNSSGVRGQTTAAAHAGVSAINTAGVGMFAQSDDLHGIEAVSKNGVGGYFQGGQAQVWLVPSSSSGPPSSGFTGQLFVDRNGVLYFCSSGSGRGATWKQVRLV